MYNFFKLYSSHIGKPEDILTTEAIDLLAIMTMSICHLM